MHSLTPSDYPLLLAFVAALWVALVFTFGRPRRWARSGLGWAIFISSWALVALLFLIGWGIISGERFPEWGRFGIATAVAVGLIWKARNIHVERRREADSEPNEPSEKETTP